MEKSYFSSFYYNNKFYLLEINTQPGMTNLSLVPEIASGTILETSCAKNPSTLSALGFFFQLNLAGFNCFNLDVASKL